MQKAAYGKFSAVVPAYNESKRCGRVIEELLKIQELAELIFVNDGSTDKTESVIKKYQSDPRFIYIKHPKNKGKGAALKTGVNTARNKIILFLDADLENITATKIKKIVKPVLDDEVDVSRGAFRLARGRVTELAVKPMMRVLFPSLYFDQPISGQVCAKKDFLKQISFEEKWGVDIGILLDAIQLGQRIVEVNIGKLEHKARTINEKAEMAEQVLQTMIEKAGLIRHKYKLVIFTLDNTLLDAKGLKTIFSQLGILSKLEKNKNLLDRDKITPKEYLERNASLFAGFSVEQIGNLCQQVPLARYAGEVIASLQKRQFKVGILSSNFSPIANAIAQRLGIRSVNCVQLEAKDGLLTGRISPTSSGWLTDKMEDAFKQAFRNIIRREKAKFLETIMVAGNEKSMPLLRMAGLGIAYKPNSKALKDNAEKTISLHAELLALVE